MDSVDTIVMPDAEPVPAKPVPRAALARLAFGSVPSSIASHTLGPRHLAFLPPESLELDLSDPAQRTFGDYELIDKLGQGGMGVVYRARQLSLEREVALKLLSAGPWASKDFIERFRREAQSAARMQHPNIVAIYEIGAHDELNFFSMRLVQGVSLAHQLQESGPLPPKRAAQLMRTIAEALDYAHRLGVLHLDLKPANVLIDERGEPQVADFGLARRLDETLTRDNDEVSGTPSYMAPEQAQIKSHKLSQATDIYGLGAILYELLTGRPPFLGATPQDTLQRVITEAPTALRQLQPTLPVDLEAICLKCLAKEPGERYASARALAEDLGRFAEGRPVSVRPLNTLQRVSSWARREPRLAAAAAVATLALVIGLAATTTQWQRADRNASDARHTLWSMRSQAAQTALADADGFRGLMPLVQNLAEMESEGRTEDAAVERQRIGTVLANAPQLIDLVRFPQGTAVSAAAVAPDGRRYAIATYGPRGKRSVRQYDLEGRELWATSTDDLEHVLVYDHYVHGRMDYAPDGSRIVVRIADVPVYAAPISADSLAFAAADGKLLGLPDLPYSDIAYSDDGSTGLVRFRENQRTRFPETGQVYDMAAGRPLSPRRALEPYEWLLSPDGRQMVGSGNFERLTAFDPATLEPRWHVQLTSRETVRAWRYSPDGSLLALGCANGVVYLVDTRDGSRSTLPSPPVAPISWLEFSREGDALVADAEDGSLAIWDVASRRPRIAPLPGDGGRKARLVGETLYQATGTQLRNWTLSPPAPFGDAAVPAPARIRSQRGLADGAFDVRPEHRLLVTGGMDGVVSVWRLPPPVLARALAAPLPGRSLHFDGEQVVAVEGGRVQLREVVSQAPRSPAFEHPEPVRYAELSDDGRTLVTIAGRTVRVLDPATGAERGAPIVLPQTPLRAELARAAPLFAVTTGAYVGDRLEETVHVIELDPVRLREHAPRVTGLLERFELDPRGRYALATRLIGDQQDFVLLDLAGDTRECKGLARSESGESAHVLDTAITDDGQRAWVAVVLPQRRTSLKLWSLADCKVIHSVTAPHGGRYLKLHAMGGSVAVHQFVAERISLFDANGQRREVPGGAAGKSMFALAVSGDGRRAAIAQRNAVELVDLARGERLSASLTAAIAGNDAIAKLAFSPDATRLLARTVKGRWLYWSLPVATQPVAELARLAALLDREGASTIPDDELEAMRVQLRAADPLARAEAPRGDPGTVALAAARGSETDPRFVPLDLGASINAPLNGQWPHGSGTVGDAPTLAPGLQRFGGVDYRVDGGVQISPGGLAFIIAPASQPEPILVPGPPVPARRVHVLALMHAPIMYEDTFRFARVVLVDERGREFPLEIRTGRDIVTQTMPAAAAPTARIAWSGIGAIYVRDGVASSSETGMNVYSVALEVPEHAGPIRSVRLQGGGELPVDAPLFFAITLEVDESVAARSGVGHAP